MTPDDRGHDLNPSPLSAETTDMLLRQRRKQKTGAPLDIPLTAEERRTYGPDYDAALLSSVNERDTDLSPTSPMLPPLSASVDVRADAFVSRAMELQLMHGVPTSDAIQRTYREFDRIHYADDHAPGWSELGKASKVIVVAILLIVFALLIPLLAYAFGALLVPLWHWGFGW
jgi:hypothetical protein